MRRPLLSLSPAFALVCTMIIRAVRAALGKAGMSDGLQVLIQADRIVVTVWWTHPTDRIDNVRFWPEAASNVTPWRYRYVRCRPIADT